MTRHLLLLPAALLWAVPAVSASCDGVATDVRQTSGDTYDPASITRQLIGVSVRRLDEGEADCADARIVLKGRSGVILLRNGGDILRTEFIRSRHVGRISPSEIELHRNALGQTARGGLSIDLMEIGEGQFVPPGEYTAVLEIQSGSEPPRSFQLAVRVMPSIRFESTDGGSRTLSLGELRDGGEARSTFFYRTNASLRVTARSDHGGVLQHIDGEQYGQIPYSATLSGRRLDLGRSIPYSIRRGSSGVQAGDLVVQVAPQGMRYAGSYRDTLTLDFTAF